MKILDNQKELKRLYEMHNALVKEKYKCNFDDFYNLLYEKGHENIDSGECYIEIPSTQTISGHAEILDW